MPRQLTFRLDQAPALTRDDFLRSQANEAALTMLEAPESWPRHMLLLIGDEGAGKTHLATIWAQEQGARLLVSSQLSQVEIDPLVTAGGAIAAELGPSALAQIEAEHAMFHLWNLCRARDCKLLLTSRTAPRDWNITLPDLRSRMDAMAQVHLMPPDEALLAAVLVKLFADKQIAAPAALIDWLVLHLDRDLGLARRFVATLDQRSMAEKRPIGRKLAAEVMDDLNNIDI